MVDLLLLKLCMLLLNASGMLYLNGTKVNDEEEK